MGDRDLPVALGECYLSRQAMGLGLMLEVRVSTAWESRIPPDYPRQFQALAFEFDCCWQHERAYREFLYPRKHRA
jgi:hypothetical protein